MEDILENPRNFSCLFSTSHIRVHLKNAILVACSSSSTTVRYNKCSSMAVTETATAPFSLSYFNKVQKLAQFYHSKNGTLKNSFLINVLTLVISARFWAKSCPNLLFRFLGSGRYAKTPKRCPISKSWWKIATFAFFRFSEISL